MSLSEGFSDNKPLLHAEGVSDRYQANTNPNSPLVLKDICLAASPGEFVSVIGPSGYGKSTIWEHLRVEVNAPQIDRREKATR